MATTAYSELRETVQSMAKDVDTYYNELRKENPNSIIIRGTFCVSLFEDFAYGITSKLSAKEQEELWGFMSILIEMAQISGNVQSSH